ncbi:hypothetical protein I33_3646 [Bacillus subtilis subsp. subtilis str. RO-NN-1]|nr:hypothetical protein I33_3646 [Bacillus subtilis subsp. subtilis str. RO-NN-1]TDU11160.1 hypothetical protein DFO78_10659 [Bacillus subtilis]
MLYTYFLLFSESDGGLDDVIKKVPLFRTEAQWIKFCQAPKCKYVIDFG